MRSSKQWCVGPSTSQLNRQYTHLRDRYKAAQAEIKEANAARATARSSSSPVTVIEPIRPPLPSSPGRSRSGKRPRMTIDLDPDSSEPIELDDSDILLPTITAHRPPPPPPVRQPLSRQSSNGSGVFALDESKLLALGPKSGRRYFVAGTART